MGAWQRARVGQRSAGRRPLLARRRLHRRRPLGPLMRAECARQRQRLRRRADARGWQAAGCARARRTRWSGRRLLREPTPRPRWHAHRPWRSVGRRVGFGRRDDSRAARAVAAAVVSEADLSSSPHRRVPRRRTHSHRSRADHAAPGRARHGKARSRERYKKENPHIFSVSSQMSHPHFCHMSNI